MLKRKGFSSIFDDIKYKIDDGEKNDVESMNECTTDPLNISSCSSSSEQENTQTDKLDITFSDGENEKNTTICVHNRSLHSEKPKSKKRKIQHKQRTPLLLHKIRRKSAGNKYAQSQVLCAKDTNLSIATTITSPSKKLLKMRNLFKVLSTTKSTQNLLHLQNEQQPFNDTQISDSIDDTPEIVCSSSSSSSETDLTPKKSTENIEVASQAPTELDLFLSLIARETAAESTQHSVKETQTKTKTKARRCKKGGFLEQLQQTLEKSKTDRKFLEHDKKFQLQVGRKFRITKLETSFGVTLATVRSEINDNADDKDDEKELGNSFQMVLDADIVKNAKLGMELEAFFNVDEVKPYIVNDKKIFVQPNKLLLL